MAETSVPSPPQVNIGQMSNLSTPTAETIQIVDSSFGSPSTYQIGESKEPTFTNFSSVLINVPRGGSAEITMNNNQPAVGDATPLAFRLVADTQDTVFSITASMFGVVKISSITILAGVGGCYVAIL